MNIRVELCHVDTLRCVVRVEAWDATRLIASSLGEASSAEEAEDRAVQRLTQRLETKKQAQNKLEKMCGDMRLTVAYPIRCAYTKPEHVLHVLRSS